MITIIIHTLLILNEVVCRSQWLTCIQSLVKKYTSTLLFNRETFHIQQQGDQLSMAFQVTGYMLFQKTFPSHHNTLQGDSLTLIKLSHHHLNYQKESSYHNDLRRIVLTSSQRQTWQIINQKKFTGSPHITLFLSFMKSSVK